MRKAAPVIPGKTLNFVIKSFTKKDGANDECVIVGMANTNDKDRVGDVVIPEAFAKSLPMYLKNPILLNNHNWDDPIGRVLKAEITDTGLEITARISDTRPDIKTLIREGVLSTFSIGYNELQADFDEDTKTKYIKELELLEISVVTVPANPEATFTVEGAAPAAGAEASATAGKTKGLKTAKALSEFIETVKSVQPELDANQVIAVCDYFNSNEDIMDKKQLIEALKATAAKSAADVAAAKAKADEAAKVKAAGEKQAKLDAKVKADAELAAAKIKAEAATKAAAEPAAAATPSEEAPPAAGAAEGEDADDKADKEILAKLGTMAEALAQILERLDALEKDEAGEAGNDPAAADAGKAQPPQVCKECKEPMAKADDGQMKCKNGHSAPPEEKPAEEMKDEDVEKNLAELQAEIEKLEDSASA